MPATPAIPSAKRANLHRSARTLTGSYVLLGLGSFITLMAMALDEWTELRGLELILGSLGLTTAILAALLVVCDLSPDGRDSWTRELACRCWKR